MRKNQINKWQFTFENVQADPSKFINVWVIDLGHKSNFWSGHGIFFRQEKLKLEQSTFEWTLKKKYSNIKYYLHPDSLDHTPSGPATTTWKYRAFCSSGWALMPGTGSCISLCVSFKKQYFKQYFLLLHTWIPPRK